MTLPFPSPRTQKNLESCWRPGPVSKFVETFTSAPKVYPQIEPCHFHRTAYAKGFNKETTILDELLDHYNEANPDVVSIQMRNYCEKKGKEKVFHIFSSQVFECCQVWKFKGSIFLTFKTEDAAKAFVAKEEKYKEETLLKKFQKDYLEEKKKEMEEKKNKYQK